MVLNDRILDSLMEKGKVLVKFFNCLRAAVSQLVMRDGLLVLVIFVFCPLLAIFGEIGPQWTLFDRFHTVLGRGILSVGMLDLLSQHLIRQQFLEVLP